MTDSSAEKKHPATPQRRLKAHEQGQFARSRDLSSACILLAAIGGLWWSGPGIVTAIEHVMQECWDWELAQTADGPGILEWLAAISLRCLWSLLPFMITVSSVTLLYHWMQAGFNIAPGRFDWDLQRVNPLAGAQRLFQWPTWIQLAFGLVKTTLIVCVVAFSLSSQWQEIQHAAALSMFELALLMWYTLLGMAFKIAFVLLAAGAMEYGVQYWRFEQSLRMTDEELREELKAAGTDPQLSNARRKLQRRIVGGAFTETSKL